MTHPALLAALAALILPLAATLGAEELINPTREPYHQALVRLHERLPASGAAKSLQVTRDGQAVPFQVEDRRIWVAADLDPGASADYRVKPGPGPAPGPELVQREGDFFVLKNAQLSLRVPAAHHDGTAPSPIAAYKPAGGSWMGSGEWSSAPEFKSFEATVVGNGPLFAKVRLLYHFAAGSAELDVLLPPDRPYAIIESRHEMRAGDGWTFTLSSGWKPTEGLLHRWFKAQHQATPDEAERFPLKPGHTRLGNTITRLQPRWTQGFDESWFFGATDNRRFAGAIVQRAGRWSWPHDNLIEAQVDAGGHTARLFLPTHRGSRSWLLVAGAAELAGQARSIVKREAFLNPDKLHNDYRLAKPGPKDKLIGGIDFYSNGTNPTSVMRQQAKRAVKEAASGTIRHDLATLYETQAFFDPDWYGHIEDHWSPINPNFHTDFIKGGIAKACMLRGHPAFSHLRKLAEDALRRDLDFAVTLPGGAGQECPGYQRHAMDQWQVLAPICKEHLGFDPRQWPRYTAAANFIARISQPDGAGRAFHPGGDTHPGQPDPLDLAGEFGVHLDPRSFVSEELPGFGAVLRNRCGTPQETFLAFKAGPNRGHYHGDQLSFHYCADAAPLAVDHHASYKPRPGQEHMHNRLSFSTPEFPHANMDGFERLVAFTSHPLADVAVAQVESPRLRKVKPLPPEDWDVAEPQVQLAPPLGYRRTVVLLKGTPDRIVLLDEARGPQLTATFNLHVLGDQYQRDGPWIRFDKLQLFVAEPAEFQFETLPWQHENGGLEQTTAARLSTTGTEHRFLTVLSPGRERPKLEKLPHGLRLDDRDLLFPPDGGIQLITKGKRLELLPPDAIDPDRSQGDVGLFVPDVGYPLGPLPDWLIEQRATP